MKIRHKLAYYAIKFHHPQEPPKVLLRAEEFLNVRLNVNRIHKRENPVF